MSWQLSNAGHGDRVHDLEARTTPPPPGAVQDDDLVGWVEWSASIEGASFEVIDHASLTAPGL